MPRTIEISHRTIVFIALFIGILWLVAQIKGLLIGLFVALLLMTAFEPLVDRLVKLKVPRAIAILVTYIVFLVLLFVGLAAIVSPLIEQTTSLVNHLPELFDELGKWLAGIGITGIDGQMIASQVSQLGRIPENLVRFVFLIFTNLVSVISVLVITFYLLVERQNLNKYLLVLFGGDGEPRAKQFIDKLQARLGGWVRGELVLMLIIGVLDYIGLVLLRVPYALPLAILAGILEIVPTIGPVISAIPAVLVGLTLSPVIGLATAALYFLVQQLENNLIVPKVMQKAVGVNPLVTIIALGVGFQLGGPLGAILAVPVLIVLLLVATEFLDLRSLSRLE